MHEEELVRSIKRVKSSQRFLRDGVFWACLSFLGVALSNWEKSIFGSISFLTIPIFSVLSVLSVVSIIVGIWGGNKTSLVLKYQNQGLNSGYNQKVKGTSVTVDNNQNSYVSGGNRPVTTSRDFVPKRVESPTLNERNPRDQQFGTPVNDWGTSNNYKPFHNSFTSSQQMNTPKSTTTTYNQNISDRQNVIQPSSPVETFHRQQVEWNKPAAYPVSPSNSPYHHTPAIIESTSQLSQNSGFQTLTSSFSPHNASSPSKRTYIPSPLSPPNPSLKSVITPIHSHKSVLPMKALKEIIHTHRMKDVFVDNLRLLLARHIFETLNRFDYLVNCMVQSLTILNVPIEILSKAKQFLSFATDTSISISISSITNSINMPANCPFHSLSELLVLCRQEASKHNSRVSSSSSNLSNTFATGKPMFSLNFHTTQPSAATGAGGMGMHTDPSQKLVFVDPLRGNVDIISEYETILNLLYCHRLANKAVTAQDANPLQSPEPVAYGVDKRTGNSDILGATVAGRGLSAHVIARLRELSSDGFLGSMHWTGAKDVYSSMSPLHSPLSFQGSSSKRAPPVSDEDIVISVFLNYCESSLSEADRSYFGGTHNPLTGPLGPSPSTVNYTQTVTKFSRKRFTDLHYFDQETEDEHLKSKAEVVILRKSQLSLQIPTLQLKSLSSSSATTTPSSSMYHLNDAFSPSTLASAISKASPHFNLLYDEPPLSEFALLEGRFNIYQAILSFLLAFFKKYCRRFLQKEDGAQEVIASSRIPLQSLFFVIFDAKDPAELKAIMSALLIQD